MSAEVCELAVVMQDETCSKVVWSVLATSSRLLATTNICQFHSCFHADKSLARRGKKQVTLPAFYRSWTFITAITTVHYLYILKPNQSMPLGITILIGAACILPDGAKNVSASQYPSLHINFNNELQKMVPNTDVTIPFSILYIYCMLNFQLINDYNLNTQ